MTRSFRVLFFMAFLWAIHSVCMAAEQPTNKPHHLTDAISTIRKNQILSDEALQPLSATELKIARNAVFARHGRGFSIGVGNYFCRRDWYHYDKAFTENRLTANDLENIAHIQKAERGSPRCPDNSTLEGAMELYLDAFLNANDNAFLALCHREHPPLHTAYDIETLKKSGSSPLSKKGLIGLEADFASKGDIWMEFFGNLGGMAQYRWLILGTTLEEWRQDENTFRVRSQGNPKEENCIYVKWQIIDGRYYIAEIAEIMC